MTSDDLQTCDRCHVQTVALVQTQWSRPGWWCPTCHIDFDREAEAAAERLRNRNRRTWHRV